MVSIDRSAPFVFCERRSLERLDRCAPEDLSHGQVIQRMCSSATAASDRFQAWLRHMNSHGWNVPSA